MKKEKNSKKTAILLEDLASLESYIFDLFTFAPLPICFASPAGVVLEFNPAFGQISGYDSFEIIGEGVELIFEKNAVEELIKETFEKGDVRAKEISLFTKDKKKIVVSAFSRARRDKEKKIVGLFIGVFDLTDIKKTERELKEKVEELEKFHNIAVGRELKMIELKNELEKLKGLATKKK